MMAGMPIDMFIEPDQDPRVEPPTTGSELATLTGFLGWHRATLELKCSGLDAEAMVRRSVEPVAARAGAAPGRRGAQLVPPAAGRAGRAAAVLLPRGPRRGLRRRPARAGPGR